MSGAKCPEEYMGCTKCCSERAAHSRKVNKPLPTVFRCFNMIKYVLLTFFFSNGFHGPTSTFEFRLFMLKKNWTNTECILLKHVLVYIFVFFLHNSVFFFCYINILVKFKKNIV